MAFVNGYNPLISDTSYLNLHLHLRLFSHTNTYLVTICLLAGILWPQSLSWAQAGTDKNIVPLRKIMADLDKDGKADMLGDTVTVSGRANVGTGVFHERYLQIYIQNDSSGLSLFSETIEESVAAGDSIIATGVVQEYFGLREVNVYSYRVISHADPYPPGELSKALHDKDRYQGMLLQGQGHIVEKGTRFNGKYLKISLPDTSLDPLMVYVTNFHDAYSKFNFDRLKIGDQIRVTGILSRYDISEPRRVFYKLFLRSPQDLEVIGIARTTLQWILLGALVLFILIGGWIFSLRRQVKVKTKELTKALQDKDMLIREIHHRIKNNLSMIVGLLELQKDETPHAEARQALDESKHRIHSIAKVHERLYADDSDQRIDVKNYLEELINGIEKSVLNQQKQIEVQTEINKLSLNPDQISTLGLLVHELLMNAYKHAFPDREKGLITVSLQQRNGKAVLTCEDNGVGIDQQKDSDDSLGMMLINSFTLQLEGELEVASQNGTSFQISFPLEYH